ncbi:MAG: hypothetical protein ACREE2_12935 [Stellaceae bacterium]
MGWVRNSVAAALATLIGSGAAAAQQRVTAAAVWQPPSGFMTRFHHRCEGRSGTAFEACFVAAMAKAGASPQALAFARRLDNDAYLEALDDNGSPVAVAHVFFPFAANENSGWLLVNGAPPLINVDDWRNLDLRLMRSSPAYLGIYHDYRNVTFWQGERGPGGPEVAQNGREFVVGYLLRNLCHACAIIGRVSYAFDFDTGGRFLGTRLVAVTPADQ